jgi:hypothetical protein
MMRTNQAAVFLIALLLPALAASCTEENPTPPRGSTSGTTSGEMSSSSSSSSGDAGSGGAGGDGGTGGTGGAGGSIAAADGHTAMDIVNGGRYMKSTNYAMVYTVGQPTQIQTTTKSPGYQMQGGLIGATGSLP